MTAWVIRAGRYGEREGWALERRCSGGGWEDIPDLTSISDRAELHDVVAASIPGINPNAIPGAVGQLWALRARIQPGDLLVMPLKHRREIALGRVTGAYRYSVEEAEPAKRHVVDVDWRTMVKRSAVKQDLLHTLGSTLTVFAPSRGDAVARLEALLATGEDPGSLGVHHEASPVGELDTFIEADQIAAERDVAEDALDQIATRIGEEFAGHDLAHLVAALLEADGFVTEESPPGIDGGIDVLAGRGALGFESPRVLVQVKTGQVGGPVISQLNGLVSTHGADFGLIATWEGLSRQARESIKHHRFRIKVWESSEIVAGYLKHFERLPEDIRSRVPLKRVWVLDV